MHFPSFRTLYVCFRVSMFFYKLYFCQIRKKYIYYCSIRVAPTFWRVTSLCPVCKDVKMGQRTCGLELVLPAHIVGIYGFPSWDGIAWAWKPAKNPSLYYFTPGRAASQGTVSMFFAFHTYSLWLYCFDVCLVLFSSYRLQLATCLQKWEMILPSSYTDLERTWVLAFPIASLFMERSFQLHLWRSE